LIENVQFGKAINNQGIIESLNLDVYKKSGLIKKNSPCVILIHGGGFGGGDKQQALYVRMANEFAARNYIVFSINYRLNLGRDSAYADARTALNWIKQNSQEYGIDISKILVLGDSAGGAIAVNLAFSNPEQTKLAGCIDLWGGLSPVKPAYTHKPSWDQPVFPLPVSSSAPPTCIIHGTEDKTVPLVTSQKLAEELEWLKVYNELHILDGAKHYDEKYADKFIPVMIDFANKVINGKAVYTEKKSEQITLIEVKGLSESPDAGYNNMRIIQEISEKCNSIKNCSIVFPKGIYPISCESGDRLFNDLLTEKIPQRTIPEGIPTLFPFSGLKKLILEGNGAKLIFNGLVRPFDFKDSKNIEVRNLTIDWERPLFSEGVVRLVKQNMLEVEIFPEFPMKGGEPILSFQTFSPETGHLTGVCPFTNITSCKLIAPQVVRFTSNDAKFVKAGEKISIRHSYHLAAGISLFNCENVRIHNFTLHASAGMGIIGQRTKNIELKRYRVFPSGKRTMSNIVDATHFISCTGTISIDSCFFQGMGDDATNVHSYYYTIAERINDNTVRVFVSHSYDPGRKYREFPDVGDKVEFIRKSSLFGYNSAIIKSTNYNDSTRETIMEFDRPLPKDWEKTDLIANLSKHPKLKFTNNVVRDVRGRGILIQTRGVLVENNSFEYCTGQGIHVDTAYPWMESISTQDVVIRKNNFINCGNGFTNYRDAMAVSVETEADEPKVGIHRNLTIEDNYVIGHTKPAFYLSSISGVKVKNNRVISSTPAVWIEYGANIEISGNNFGSCKVETGLNCSGIEVQE
jgi:acetyl esterase/lipase